MLSGYGGMFFNAVEIARQAPALPPPSSSVRHYLPLSKLTMRLIEVATQACSTTNPSAGTLYGDINYVLLCGISTQVKVKHND